MKNFLLIILLTVFIPISLTAQSKAETEKWITEKYNYYERPLNLEYDLFFEDDYLYYISVLGDYHAQATRIKVKDIKEIEIKKRRFDANDKEGWYVIHIFFQEGKTEDKDLLNSNGVYVKDDFGTGFQILLSSEFSQDDMPKRMTKAFVNLISLNGGKVKVKNEAF